MSKDELPMPVYRSPTVDMTDADLEDMDIMYDDTPPGTFVVSGPLVGGPGKGRRFDDIIDAEEWVNTTYGRHYGRVRDAEEFGRWAFRVLPKSK